LCIRRNLWAVTIYAMVRHQLTMHRHLQRATGTIAASVHF
jgi:hypothetical protein